MSSLRRILSSRANGARSRGPITAAGKKASSQNAIRHGLLAKCLVLENESREGFDALMAQYIDRFAPLDDVELGIIEEMVAAFWRLRRAWAIETRLLDQAMDTVQTTDEMSRLAGAFSNLAASPQLALLHRYEARLHHISQRALENLYLLRNAVSPNEPGSPAAPLRQPAAPRLPNEPDSLPPPDESGALAEPADLASENACREASDDRVAPMQPRPPARSRRTPLPNEPTKLHKTNGAAATPPPIFGETQLAPAITERSQITRAAPFRRPEKKPCPAPRRCRARTSPPPRYHPTPRLC